MSEISSHCKFCFDVLAYDLKVIDQIPSPEFDVNEETAVFVTWLKNGDLRGCIGTFSPGKAEEVLKTYSVVAAKHDSRFPPVEKGELTSLSCGVSLLHNFQDRADPWDFELGRHGVIFSYGGRDGTFLPEVAVEQGWSKRETILHCLNGKVGVSVTDRNLEDFLKSVQLRTYESKKSEISYEEWKSACSK